MMDHDAMAFSALGAIIGAFLPFAVLIVGFWIKSKLTP